MRESYRYYTSASPTTELLRYLHDEVEFNLRPTTGDYSNVMAHKSRLNHAQRLVRERIEYNQLMGIQ